MKKLFFIILVLALCFPIVTAETLTGTLGAPSTLVSIDETLAGYGSDNAGAYGTTHYLKFLDISNDYGMTAVVLHTGSKLGGYDGIHEGVSIPFVAQLNAPGGTNLFTGSIGYTRIFAGDPAVEVDGYVYIVTDNFNQNTIGLSGPQLIYLNYTEADWYGTFIVHYTNGPVMAEPGMVCFQPPAIVNVQYAGDSFVNKYTTFQNEYSATKPSGIGISGSVVKQVNSVVYPSRSYIYDGTTNNLLASEPTINPDTFTFNVPAASIKIGVAYSLPAQINSSVLFTSVVVTPTPDPNAVPAGYTRTTVYAQDASIGTVITGATLSIRDVQNNTWVNATSTSAGTQIDVLNGHTLDIYGSYPGVYTASQELDAYAGGSYYLPLYPPAVPAASGFVNLVVSVYESGTGGSIQYCGLSWMKSSTTAVTHGSTGATGTEYFVVPNNTVIILSATKNGWNGQSKSLTTINSDIYTTFTLSRATLPTATPTVTGTDGHVITAVPTVDARTNAEKDAALMNQLRDNGPMLVGLCILAIAFGIIKMIMKF